MGRHHFIVIDDDSSSNLIAKLVISKFLEPLDLQLFSRAENGLQYIQSSYTEEEKPTILLLDINMPYMSGWEFLSEFEKLEDNIQKQFDIYMLSSSIDENDKNRAHKNKNVSGYIVKPLIKEKIMTLFGK